MSGLKSFLTSLGLDGWVLGLTGLAAIVVSILGFTPFITIAPGTLTQMIFAACGIIMAAVAVQTGRDAAETRELGVDLRKALGHVQVEPIESERSQANHLVTSVLQTQSLVLDASLIDKSSRGVGDPQREYNQILDRRLKEGTISLRRVVVISSQKSMERLIQDLLTHKDQNYFVKHVSPPPKPVPLLNILSFDNGDVYMGKFYPGQAPAEEPMIYVHNPDISEFMKAYWSALWNSAISLNDDGTINWTELKQIALRIGMSEAQFESMLHLLTNVSSGS